MMTKSTRWLFVLLLCLLSGCGKPDLLCDEARADFFGRYPLSKIVKVYAGKRNASHADIYIRFVHTPAAAFPPQISIFEMMMGYRREGSEWLPSEEVGSC